MMINYLEIDSEGTAVGGIYSLPEEETAPENWIEVQGEEQVGWVFKEGTWEKPFVDNELSYDTLRALAYPNISDQLDMIYWDKVNGTNQWQQAITTIKATYPKDIQE